MEEFARWSEKLRQTAYINGQILTMDKYRPKAQAVLISNGKIKTVGTTKEVQQAMHATAKVVDLKQKTMIPGFVDGHSHLTAVAYESMFGNAAPSPKGKCDSLELLLEELKMQLQEKKRKPDTWFIAMGYDASGYENGREPQKEDLDQISREHPICLTHASGHCGVLNSKALALVGIDQYTPDPAGGKIERKKGSKEPTGLLQEQAFFLVSEKIPLPSLKETLQGIKKAVNLYASYGITTAQDARTRDAEYELLHVAALMGQLPLDVVSCLEPSTAKRLLKPYGGQGAYQKHYRAGGYKIFLDGSPQAKTAWLKDPYVEAPKGETLDYCGYPALKDQEVLEHIRICLKNGWQLQAHANGDAAIEQFIRCFQKAREELPEEIPMRPVLIHCQMVRKDQLNRMKKLGILPSFFLDHVYFWGDYHVQSVLGEERASRISPAYEAMELGMSFTLHQDSPVVPPNMLLSVHNAVNRRTKTGRLLGGNQRIPVEEALRAVTLYGAYQIFEEQKKGSIQEGKLADLVILNQNPLETEPEKLREIQVLQTIKEGKVIYQKKKDEKEQEV